MSLISISIRRNHINLKQGELNLREDLEAIIWITFGTCFTILKSLIECKEGSQWVKMLEENISTHKRKRGFKKPLYLHTLNIYHNPTNSFTNKRITGRQVNGIK